MSFIDNRINELKEDITHIDNKITHIKETIQEKEANYNDNIILHRQKCIDSILSSYEFPDKEQVELLKNDIENLDNKINNTKKELHSYDHMKNILSNDVKYYEQEILEYNQNILKCEETVSTILSHCGDSKNVKHILNIIPPQTTLNDGIKLNKWQQRKHISVKHKNFFIKKKTIKNNLRQLDKNIKTIYLKLVDIEKIKNNILNSLSQKYESDRKFVTNSINPYIYTKINIPINKILTDDTYMRFKRELLNKYTDIDIKYNVNVLKEDINTYISQYKTYLHQLKDLDTGNIPLEDMSNINNKYNNLIRELKTLNKSYSNIKYKQEKLNTTLYELENQLNNLNQQKNNINKYLINYEEKNQNIINKIVDTKINRFKIKQSSSLKKYITKLENDIKKLKIEKEKLTKELSNICSLAVEMV